jgi:hypothetical protein
MKAVSAMLLAPDVIFFAVNVPIVAGGSRGDQKTEDAVDVELAKIRVLCPGDPLELWCLLNGLLPVCLEVDVWCLDSDHIDSNFSQSYVILTVLYKERAMWPKTHKAKSDEGALREEAELWAGVKEHMATK